MSNSSGESQQDKFQRQLNNAICAGSTLLSIRTAEWQRLEASISKAINLESGNHDHERLFLQWNEQRDWRVWKNGNWSRDDEDLKNLNNYETTVEQILHLRDEFGFPFVAMIDDHHPEFNKASAEGPTAMRLLRDLARIKRDKPDEYARKTFVFTGEFINLAKEINHELVSLEMPLPDLEILSLTYRKVVGEKNLKSSDYDDEKEVVKAALGLTVMEAETAFSHAIAETGRLDASSCRSIMNMKKEIIRQSSALEYIEAPESMNNVGGLGNLKRWLEKRHNALSDEAKQRGLPRPKGVLLTGVPGCGKSLSAKAIASQWSLPLIRFDVGAVFGGIVGESEGNIRNALRVAEAASPCILWIDEIEKALAGSGGSGDLDSGVGQRVFGEILRWMNDNVSEVFVVATANNLSNLPPELKRKGRFDEIFFVDLPSESSRSNIFEIHLNLNEPSWREQEIDVHELARLTKQWTGAEIEACIQDSVFTAFSDGNREVTINDLRGSIRSITPQAQSMKEDIEAMRSAAAAIGQFAELRNDSSNNGGGNVYG